MAPWMIVCARRDQRIDESVETYVAELKRLYDKSFMTRDLHTRTKDLLRRFIEETARFHVEYIEDSADFDHAMYEVVNFQETKPKQGKWEAAEKRSGDWPGKPGSVPRIRWSHPRRRRMKMNRKNHLSKWQELQKGPKSFLLQTPQQTSKQETWNPLERMNTPQLAQRQQKNLVLRYKISIRSSTNSG